MDILHFLIDTTRKLCENYLILDNSPHLEISTSFLWRPCGTPLHLWRNSSIPYAWLKNGLTHSKFYFNQVIRDGMITNSSSAILNIGDIHVAYQVFEKSCLAKVLVKPGLMDVSLCLKAIHGKPNEVCTRVKVYILIL